jgi:glucose-6-phosphate isomerase, archaeal
MNRITDLFARFDPDTGMIHGGDLTARRLSDLRSAFARPEAVDAVLRTSDPVIYTVSTVHTATGEGQLHYGAGRIMPGRIGDEYYLTKGHLHSWRPAAELYIGMRGLGKMILQEESSGKTIVLDLLPYTMVYIPGGTAHRTVNVGDEPLMYLGVYPAAAGHDYAPLARNNFSTVIVARDGKPVTLDRSVYLAPPNHTGNTHTQRKSGTQ